VVEGSQPVAGEVARAIQAIGDLRAGGGQGARALGAAQGLGEAQQAVAALGDRQALGGGGAEVFGVEGAIEVGVGAGGLDAGQAVAVGIPGVGAGGAGAGEGAEGGCGGPDGQGACELAWNGLGRPSGSDFEHQNADFPARNGHRQLSKMEWLWRPWNLELCLTVDLAGSAIPHCDNWNLTPISEPGQAVESIW
jgi:hypothetical protein